QIPNPKSQIAMTVLQPTGRAKTALVPMIGYWDLGFGIWDLGFAIWSFSRDHLLHRRLIQTLIERARSHQLLMRADVDDAAFIQDDDAIRDLQGVQPMRDQEGRPPLDEFLDGAMDAQLAIGVDGAGELIED